MSASSLLLVGIVRLVAGQVQASTSAESVAQVLFEEGLTLMEAGRFDDACPKLAESQRLDPGGGTLMNLASCFERQGKLASAYATYNDALSMAIRDARKDREVTVREHISALQPSLSKLVVRPREVVPDMQVSLDGTPLGPPAWGLPLPVDPGDHEVSIRAPGRAEVVLHVQFGSEPQTKTLTVPTLALLSDTAAAPLPPAALADVAPSRRTAAFATGGIALALLTAGGITGGLALDAKATSDAECPSSSLCSQRGVDAIGRADTYAWTANVTIGLGLAAAGVATYLFLTEPRSARTATRPISMLRW